jgi:hypothetical protein
MARPPERIAGQALVSAHSFSRRRPVTLQQVLTSKPSYRAEIQLRTETGVLNPAQLSSIALSIDGVRNVAVVVTDLRMNALNEGFGSPIG